MRLAVVGIAPAPYRNGLFERIAATDNTELRVFYLHGEDSLRGWTRTELSYPAEFVPCWTPESAYRLPLLGAVNPDLVRRLETFRPDVMILYGHSYWSQFVAARWAHRSGVPYFLRCDSGLGNLDRGRDGSGVRFSEMKRRIVSAMAAGAAGVLTIGGSNARFWERHGVEVSRRFFAPMAVDNDWFEQSSRSARARREEIRARMGIRTPRVLLFAGRFVEQKNLPALIRAWRDAAASDCSLLLVGDGPNGDLVRSTAASAKNVFCEPLADSARMPELYAASDGLILPSIFEPWGLVVNEAMACGLPVLVSSHCGCAEDLVAEDETGMVFDPRDQEGLVRVLKRFGEMPDEPLRRMGETARARIQAWGYEATIAGFAKAFASVGAG